MKKLFLALILTFTAVSFAFAQDDDRPKFGMGVTFGIATGRIFDYYPVASGVILRYEQPVADNSLNLLFSTGFTYFVSSEGYGAGYNNYGSYSYGDIAAFVPVQAGVKAYVAGRFFLQGLVGASVNVNSNYRNYTDKKVGLLLTPAVGYNIPFGRTRWGLDASLGYEHRAESGVGYNQVKASAVFNISL